LSESAPQIKEFSIFSVDESFPIPFPFSSDAWEKFLKGNERLEVIDFYYIKLSSNVCDIIGRAPLNLKRLELTFCELDMQRFVNVLERNVSGPKEIKLNSCISDETGRDYALSHSTVLEHLMNCKRMKSLHIEDRASPTLTSDCDFNAIKVEFESAQSLEHLKAWSICILTVYFAFNNYQS
jgi:hypothetical protein